MQRARGLWARASADRELPELRRRPFSRAHTLRGVTGSALCSFQDVFVRACVRAKEVGEARINAMLSKEPT